MEPRSWAAQGSRRLRSCRSEEEPCQAGLQGSLGEGGRKRRQSEVTASARLGSHVAAASHVGRNVRQSIHLAETVGESSGRWQSLHVGHWGNHDHRYGRRDRHDRRDSRLVPDLRSIQTGHFDVQNRLYGVEVAARRLERKTSDGFVLLQ